MFKVGSLVMLKRGNYIVGYNSKQEQVTRNSACRLYFTIIGCRYLSTLDKYVCSVRDDYGYNYYVCEGSLFIQPAEGVLTLEELERIKKLNHV